MKPIKKKLDHFTDFFKGFQNDYVIIGGMAAYVHLDEADLEFRGTKDVDMVILTNSSQELNKRIIEYIEAGEYQTKEATDNIPKFYRFSKPNNEIFPEIIEIFARNETELPLKTGQYIIPVQKGDQERLSAILLDDEYFNLIKQNSIKSEDGYSIVNTQANICLKARAFREIRERNEEIKKINKHRNDILKLTLTLKDDPPLKLDAQIKKDFMLNIEELENMDAKTFKQVMLGYPKIEKSV
jgi:hypothetical protein